MHIKHSEGIGSGNLKQIFFWPAGMAGQTLESHVGCRWDDSSLRILCPVSASSTYLITVLIKLVPLCVCVGRVGG